VDFIQYLSPNTHFIGIYDFLRALDIESTWLSEQANRMSKLPPPKAVAFGEHYGREDSDVERI
jgi:hypothetical protein